MRLKIIAGNLVAVLVVGLVSFFVVRSDITADVTADIDNQITNDRTLFERSWLLSARTFIEQVSDRAATGPVRASFAGLDEDTRRARAFEAANAVSQWFGDPARGRQGSPDLVAIMSNDGKVLARSLDPQRMYGLQLQGELPALRGVLTDGAPRHDVWRKRDENKFLRVGLAAVRNDAGGIIGALLVAYDLSNGLAKAEGDLLGRGVAFVTEGKVYSSSLRGGDGDALGALFFEGELKDAVAAVLASPAESPATTNVWKAKLGERAYTGVAARLPMAPSAPVGYAIMADATAHLTIASNTNIILILMGLGVLGVLVYGFMVGSSFLRPVEEIEEGVLAVINGNTDLRLEVESAEFGGLAYRINQLINVFTGVREEDSDGRISQPPGEGTDAAWEAGAAPAAPAPAGGAPAGDDVIDDPAVAASLAAEPEDAYYGRVYREYVQAKVAAGEDVSNIPQDRFVQRLKGNEASLVKKHGCRAVRFQVQARGAQVSLRPVLIR